MRAEGVPQGERLAVLTRSHLDALVALLAAQQLGLIYMPLNWRSVPYLAWRVRRQR
ncbi:hypothetical protein NH396_04405 [Cobetia sp. Dlab-2-AX]|nr:hypothetical protein [Cobetia sp. Dlab-2-AX]MCO7234971.1 hypothetical protein [Cobetia sp. Dlab-2-U]